MVDLLGISKEEIEIEEALTKIACEFIQYRSENKMTQVQLAEKLGVGQSMISKLESMEYNPTIRFLMEIAQKLDWNIEIKINSTHYKNEEVRLYNTSQSNALEYKMFIN
jgi:Predicted transcriptional regulators